MSSVIVLRADKRLRNIYYVYMLRTVGKLHDRTEDCHSLLCRNNLFDFDVFAIEQFLVPNSVILLLNCFIESIWVVEMERHSTGVRKYTFTR